MKYIVLLNGRSHTVSIDAEGQLTCDGEPAAVDLRPVGEHAYSVILHGQSVRVVALGNGGSYDVLLGSKLLDAVVESERDVLVRKYARPSGRELHRREIRAPMPALVIRIEVNVGDNVSAGQGLLVLEAMKMENEMKAPQEGKVKEIHARQGQRVEKGEMLLVLE
jgi:acetyl/propionyl-CoA carboxylase alpha subunit